jgi:hypothetical protein
MPQYLRFCSKCEKQKDDSEFYSIFHSWCAECQKVKSREYYQRNKEDEEFMAKRADSTRAWREKYPDKALANKERVSARQRAKTRLAEMFPEEFNKLLQSELRKLKKGSK